MQPGYGAPPAQGRGSGMVIAVAILVGGSFLVCLGSAIAAYMLFGHEEPAEPVAVVEAPRPQTQPTTTPTPVNAPVDTPQPTPNPVDTRGPFDVGRQWSGSLLCDADEHPAAANLSVTSVDRSGQVRVRAHASRPMVRYEWIATGTYEESTRRARFEFREWDRHISAEFRHAITLDGTLDATGRRYEGTTGNPDCPRFVFSR